MIKLRYMFFLCLVLILSGCGHKMALSKGQSDINVNKKSIVLMSVKIANQNKPDRQLEILGATIVPRPASETSKWDRKAGNLYKAEGALFRSEKDSFNEYLLSFELENGINTIMSLWTWYTVPLLVNAQAHAPLNMEVNITPNSINYLGHLDVILREKKNDGEEIAATFPLVDAGVAGYSTGTFDVIVEDKYDEDLKLFISEYPGLQNVKVEKSILPQWIRPENRKM